MAFCSSMQIARCELATATQQPLSGVRAGTPLQRTTHNIPKPLVTSAHKNSVNKTSAVTCNGDQSSSQDRNDSAAAAAAGPAALVSRRAGLGFAVSGASLAAASLLLPGQAARAEQLPLDQVQLLQLETLPATPPAAPADVADANVAEAAGDNAEPSPSPAAASGVRQPSTVYLDIGIEGANVGRLVIELFPEEAPLGAARFREICQGQRGVSFRRKEMVKLTPSYVQNGGLRAFSLTGGEADAARFTGGTTADLLLEELQAARSRPDGGLRNLANSVSIVVFDPTLPPPKEKLIAQGGKLVMVEEESLPPPNGTQFSISFRDAPELDSTNLVVGKVVSGFDVLEQISQVPYVKENTSSPYFKAAKLIGDTRAVVAERGFFRPYKKIVITKCGILS